MLEKITIKYSFFTTVLRLWFFLVVSLVIIATMFPVSIPFCGEGGNAEGSKLSGSQFATLLGANALSAPVLVKLRYFLLFLTAAVVVLIAINLAVSLLFSIQLR
jgi:hypothetical protein